MNALTTSQGGNFNLVTLDGQTLPVETAPVSAPSVVPTLDRQFDDSVEQVCTAGETTGVCQVTWHPTVSPSALLTITGWCTNDSGEEATTVAVGWSTGTAPGTVAYSQAAIPVAAGATVSFALTVITDQAGSGPEFPLNEDTLVNAVLIVGSGAAVDVSTAGVQLTVVEMLDGS